MSIDPKFVELTADVLKIFFYNIHMLRGKSAIQRTTQDASSHSRALLRECAQRSRPHIRDGKRNKHARLYEIATSQLHLRRVHPFHLNVTPPTMIYTPYIPAIILMCPSMTPPAIAYKSTHLIKYKT